MTIENIIVRFLKENGLYDYFLKRNRRYKYKKENIIDPYLFSSNTFYKEGIKSIFYLMFSYDVRFYGMSTSPQRRLFYKLNRKWKDFVNDNFVVQHNVSPGDIIFRNSLFGRKIRYKVKNVNGDKLEVSSLDNKYLQKLFISVLTVDKIEDKELVKNIYFKNNFNGKIEGNYNEVQL